MSTFGKIGARPLIKPPFVELEWLQGDGASGILFPWDVSTGGVFSISYYRGSLATDYILGQRLISGVNNQALAFEHRRNNDKLSSQNITYYVSPYAVGSPWFSTSSSAAQLSRLLYCKIDLDDKKAIWFDDSTSSMGSWSHLPTSTHIGLFGWANASGTGFYNYGKPKVCSFTILKNGKLLYDMIPVRRDDTGYMYNKVTGQFMEKIGTGAFVLGPDKVGGGGVNA